MGLPGTSRLKPFFGFLALALLAAVGCGGTVDKHVVVNQDVTAEPLYQPIPATVGIHYGALRDHKTVLEEEYRERGVTYRYHLALGAPSIALFDRALGAMFERTVQLPASAPSIAPADARLDGVVEVALMKNIQYFRWEVSLSYAITLNAPDGARLAQWQVLGYGEGSDPRPNRLKRAMRSAVAQFMIGFEKKPEVRAWLASLPGKGGGGAAGGDAP